VEITFEAADPPALAAFWSEFAGDEIELTFVWSDIPKIEKNRVHLDLASTSPEHQADIVARALKLGAEHADVGQIDVPWEVLRSGDGFASVRPEPGPWLEFVRTDDPEPITNRVRVRWADPA
jgi:hypothetical protein